MLNKNENFARIAVGMLVLGSIATSLVQKTDLFNIALIVLSLALTFCRSSIPTKSPQPFAIRVWAISLVVCSLIWTLSILNTADSDLSDYEKPLKYLVCVVIAMQLPKLGISSRFVFWGAVLCLIVTFIEVSGQVYGRLELGMNAGTAGYQVCIVLLIVVSYLLFEKNLRVWEYACGSVAIVFGAWLILETQTRGALVVLTAYALIVGVEKVREAPASRRITISILTVLALLVLTGIAGSSSIVKQRIDAAISDLNRIEQGYLTGSIGRRVALLQVGFYAVKNPTLLGRGENSSENLKSYLAEMENGERYEFLLQNLHFHNQYLDQFTKRGVLGFLAYLVFLLGPLFLASPEKRRALYAAVVPLGVGGLIETPYNNSNFITSYLLYVTFILIVQHNQNADLKSDQGARDYT